jgi:hypothetical protein
LVPASVLGLATFGSALLLATPPSRGLAGAISVFGFLPAGCFCVAGCLLGLVDGGLICPGPSPRRSSCRSRCTARRRPSAGRWPASPASAWAHPGCGTVRSSRCPSCSSCSCRLGRLQQHAGEGGTLHFVCTSSPSFSLQLEGLQLFSV